MRGKSRQFRLLYCTALVTFGAGPALADDQDPGRPTGPLVPGDIVVVGERQQDPFAGILADDELDENDIAAYGFNTIGELLGEISREVQNDPDGPVVLINGQQTYGISDVADLPTEAVSRIQVLPRGAATRVGQSASRRVINVVIKPHLRQVTGNANGRMATRGDAVAVDGEANLLRLDEGNRASLVLRASHVDPLLEGQRGIVSDTSGTPYDIVGNVIAPGASGAEIDPALSALAGFPVVVAGVPVGNAAPTLAAFLPSANQRNLSDFGSYRTLQAQGDTYSANANLTRRLDQSTTVSLTGRMERSMARSLNGAATALFTVPAGSRYSPFTRDVVVARSFGDPLPQDVRSTNLAMNGSLNTRLGAYSLTLLAGFNHRVSQTDTARDYDTSAIQAGIAAGMTDPFAPVDPAVLGSPRSDLSHLRSDNGQAQAIVNGPLAKLPAGSATISAKLLYQRDTSRSRTTGRSFNFDSTFARSEKTAQLGVTLPLAGDAFLKALGVLTLDLNGAVRDVSGAPTLHDYGATMNWDPGKSLNFRFGLNIEETAPPSNALNDPIVVVDNFRTFDFVRQETVSVRYVTGGNPALPVQQTTRTVAGATFRPFGNPDLTLTAEYQRIIGRNAFAALPPADARVQLAFPDRYIRDANGVLVQLDARPITYARDRQEFARWGVALRRTFGGTVSAGESEGLDNSNGVSGGRGWRLNFTADHTWYLDSTRLVRPGLPVIDLLDGGAAGYAGGQPRHFVRVTGAIYHAGIGLQFSGDYRGASSVEAGTDPVPDRIRFASRTTIDTRLFVNLGPQFPSSALAKGARMTLAFSNLFDSKQRVTDATGSTPLRYQPFLLDPLGRTITLSLRKVF